MLSIAQSRLDRNTTSPRPLIDAMADSVFPLEIHALLVDILATEKCSLSAYSQTCYTMLPFCRKHTFAQVFLNFPWRVFGNDNIRKRQREFAAILAESPEIANCIRKVHIEFSEYPFYREEKAILEALHLNVGSIVHFGLSTYDQTWGKILAAPCFGPLMLAILSSSCLVSLDIQRNIEGFKMVDFRNCTNLSRLHVGLHGSVVLDDELMNPDPSKLCLPPNLQYLRIQHSGRPQGLLPAARLTASPAAADRCFALQSFHASTISTRFGLTQIILAHVKGLKAFVLEWDFFDNFQHSTQLGESLQLHAGSLTSLMFVFPYHPLQNGTLESLFEILDLISKRPSAGDGNAIQQLTILICIDNRIKAERLSEICNQMDATLSSSHAWPSLKKVSIESLVITNNLRLIGDSLQSLPEHFPCLLASGLIEFRLDHVEELEDPPPDIHPILLRSWALRYRRELYQASFTV